MGEGEKEGMAESDCGKDHITLQDISAITSGYTLINMYLFQFDYKKGQKTGFHIK